MKWGEIKRLAELSGWKLERHGAKHDVYRHPSKPGVLMLERHFGQEARKGVMMKVLKQIEQ